MQFPDLSRRSVLSVVAIVTGVVVIALAVLGGSGPSKKSATTSRPEVVKPVQPIDPDDKYARRPRKKDVTDVADPFAESFGASGRRKVTVSVSGSGYVSIAVYYRDRKKPRVLHAPTFTEARKVKGRFPLAAVVIQIPSYLQESAASKATCSIVIDGIEVARESVSGRWDIATCIG